MLRINNHFLMRRFPAMERPIAVQKSLLPIQFSQHVYTCNSSLIPYKPTTGDQSKKTSSKTENLILASLVFLIPLLEYLNNYLTNYLTPEDKLNEIIPNYKKTIKEFEDVISNPKNFQRLDNLLECKRLLISFFSIVVGILDLSIARLNTKITQLSMKVKELEDVKKDLHTNLNDNTRAIPPGSIEMLEEIMQVVKKTISMYELYKQYAKEKEFSLIQRLNPSIEKLESRKGLTAVYSDYEKTVKELEFLISESKRLRSTELLLECKNNVIYFFSRYMEMADSIIESYNMKLKEQEKTKEDLPANLDNIPAQVMRETTELSIQQTKKKISDFESYKKSAKEKELSLIQRIELSIKKIERAKETGFSFLKTFKR